MPIIAPFKTPVDQVAQITRSEALQSGLIAEETLKKYDFIQSINRDFYRAELNAALAEQSQQEMLAQRERNVAKEKFKQGLAETEKLSPGEQNQIAKYIALLTETMSAGANFERTRSFSTPQERFETYLKDGLLNSGDPKEFLARTGDTVDKMILSTVFTMHPTIWHTQDARVLEKRVTEILEARAQGMRPAEGKGFELLPDEALQQIKDELQKAIGKNLTPMKKVTVPLENEAEDKFIAAMRGAADSVINDWNEAAANVKGWTKEIAGKENRTKEEERLAKANLSDSEFDRLQVSEPRRQKLLEFRTWGKEFDADGREASTSTGFSQWIRDAVKNGAIVTGDMRDNSSQLIDVTSALVQTAYHRSKHSEEEKYKNWGFTSDFYQHTLDFAREAEEKGKVQKGWLGADDSVMQQLSAKAQSEFLQKIIKEFSKSDRKEQFRLIPPEIYDRTLQYCEFYYNELNQFLKDKNLPKGTTYDQLAKQYRNTDSYNMQDEFNKRIKAKEFKTAEGEVYSYEIQPGGYYQASLEDKGRDLLRDRVRVVEKDGKLEKAALSEKDRRMLMDVAKRLIVVNDAIVQHGDKGVIADRYQIANFENPAHFYALMLLMQQTGIMEIEDGKVKSSKLAIQPLIETAEDRKNAKSIYEQLLKDDLGRSYFEAMNKQKGYVEIMMGFSDGASTGGNFASEWGIYKCMKELSDLFAEQKPPMKVRFLQGRGRGNDRGGEHEAGLEITTTPPKVADLAILDTTRQSDLPQQAYLSQASGKDMFASAMLGTLTARDHAVTMTEKDRQRLETYENACQFIADRAEKYYAEIVRSRADGQQLVFFDALPANTDIASRAAKREGEKATPESVARLSIKDITKRFDKTRAITKEYHLRRAGLAAYDAGLRRALDDYRTASDGKFALRVQKEDGTRIGGKEALQEMYQNFDFFRNVVDKIHLGVKEGHSPIRAEAYGEKTKTQAFVKDVSESVGGLLPTLDLIRAPGLWRANSQGDASSKDGALYQINTRPSLTWSVYTQGARNLNVAQDAFKQLNHMSHLLILAQDHNHWNGSSDSKVTEERLQMETMHNCLFTASVAGIQQGLHGQNDVAFQTALQPRVTMR